MPGLSPSLGSLPVVNLFSEGLQEVTLNQFDIEALIAPEGVKPSAHASDAALK